MHVSIRAYLWFRSKYQIKCINSRFVLVTLRNHVLKVANKRRMISFANGTLLKTISKTKNTIIKSLSLLITLVFSYIKKTVAALKWNKTEKNIIFYNILKNVVSSFYDQRYSVPWMSGAGQNWWSHSWLPWELTAMPARSLQFCARFLLGKIGKSPFHLLSNHASIKLSVMASAEITFWERSL